MELTWIDHLSTGDFAVIHSINLTGPAIFSVFNGAVSQDFGWCEIPEPTAASHSATRL